MRIQSRVEIKRMFMIFFLALTLILFIQHPLLVHAAGGSMTATDVAGGSLNDVGGGPTYVHSGYIFYLVDTKGNEVTGVRAMTSYSWMPIQDSKGNEISKSNVAMVSRKGTEASGNVVMGAPFPCGSPFGSDGSGNGDEIKAWLLAKAENGHTNAANFIRKMFSTYHAEKWEKKEVYLVYEVVGWNHLYKDKKSTGIWFCGTTSRFGIVQNALNINADGKGDSTINRYTNNIYPNCMKLEDCKEIRAMGYKAPTHSGIVSNKEMGTRAEVFSGTCNNGWGIGVVWNEESKVIHTYDSINSPGEPEKAEGDKKGTSNIVKCYYTEKKENGVVKELINDGTFTREQCTNKISIDNEPEYQIEKWVVSSTYDPTVQSTLDGKTVSFDVPASIQETGTSAEVKTLSDPKSTVYVLLKHSTNQVVKPVVTGANYEISESSITRRIWFATPDSQGSMPQIASYTFLWTIGAHKTSCDGHNCGGCTCFGHAGSHDSSCPPDCSDDHTYYCGLKHDCVIHYCSGWKWKERILLLSIDNPYKNDYPDILATKSGWQTETEVGAVHKHYYINDSSFSRASTDKQYYPHYQIW